MTGTISVWKDQSNEQSFPTLTQDITVDVAIIGGGITGITAAYILSKAGKRVAVLEARQVGKGSTGSSTGNLYCTIGSPGLHNLKSKWNLDVVKQVIESRGAAVDFIEARVREFNIDCDFVRVPWALFTENEDGKSFVEKERETAEQAGLTVTENFQLPVKVHYGFTGN